MEVSFANNTAYKVCTCIRTVVDVAGVGWFSSFSWNQIKRMKNAYNYVPFLLRFSWGSPGTIGMLFYPCVSVSVSHFPPRSCHSRVFLRFPSLSRSMVVSFPNRRNKFSLKNWVWRLGLVAKSCTSNWGTRDESN